MGRRGTTKQREEGNKRGIRHLCLVVSNQPYVDTPKFTSRWLGRELRMKKLMAPEVADGLRVLAKNWDSEIEGLLGLPKELFLQELPAGAILSKDEDHCLRTFAQNLALGTFPLPKTDFAIVLHATSEKEYFVLFDASRRIIIRQVLGLVHGVLQQGDWRPIKDAIKVALAEAESDEARRGGLFAYFNDDGIVKPVKPHKTS